VVVEFDDIDLHDVPLGHRDSFLDYEAVVLFAGAFESIKRDAYSVPDVRSATDDLDRREREFYTMRSKGIPLVVLVPPILDRIHGLRIADTTDLFRRLTSRLPFDWQPLEKPVASLKAQIAEFGPFIEKHGIANVVFAPTYEYKGQATLIAGLEKAFLAFAIGRNLFFLPSHMPHTHDDACAIAALAARCVLAYRERVSTEMPEWGAAFRFERENQLRAQAAQHRAALTQLEGEIDVHVRRKGALCFKSEPLVEVVTDLLGSVCGLRVMADDRKIEDARILDDADNVLAVGEIKGDNGSFKREDVNQVDNHRERLGLAASTPGFLIVNTMMKAQSLAEKDERPHPDIIKKAVSDNVLMLRTLDLLRYADLIEQGKRSKADFRKDVLSNAGWLKVGNDTVEIVKR